MSIHLPTLYNEYNNVMNIQPTLSMFRSKRSSGDHSITPQKLQASNKDRAEEPSSQDTPSLANMSFSTVSLPSRYWVVVVDF
jgi:hypothetical protein